MYRVKFGIVSLIKQLKKLPLFIKFPLFSIEYEISFHGTLIIFPFQIFYMENFSVIYSFSA